MGPACVLLAAAVAAGASNPGAAGGGHEPPLRFHQLSLAEGLSQVSVFCLLVDSRGFLWIGTEYGLNRYDTYAFTVFIHDPEDPTSLAANRVLALAEDRDGYILVGTEAGLDRLDPVSGRFQHLPLSGEARQRSAQAVRAIVADPDGTVWLATDSGLRRLAGATGALPTAGGDAAPAEGLPAGRITALHRRAGGPLWVGSEDGLYRLDGGASSPVAIPLAAGPVRVSAMVEGDDGTLWVATAGQGLFRRDTAGTVIRYRSSPDDPATLSADDLASLCLDGQGHLWIGTRMQGLDRLDLASGAVLRIPPQPGTEGALQAKQVSALALGHASLLWIGTNLAGLARLDLMGSPFLHYHRGASGALHLASNTVLSVAEDARGELWVGLAAGVQRSQRARDVSRPFVVGPPEVRAALRRPVYAIHEDRQGVLWFGTWEGGLVRVDPTRSTARVFRHDSGHPASLASDSIFAVLEDREGRLWVGTVGGGLDEFEHEAGVFRHHPAGAAPPALSGNTVRTLLEDRHGYLWVGTVGGGLSVRDPRSGAFSWFRHNPDDPQSLSDDAVTGIFEDRDGTIWVATAAGLNRFDRRSATFRSYRVRDGLPSDALTGVAEDAMGRLWVAHFRGLSCLEPTTGVWTNFGASHGLQSNEFNSAAVATGRDGTLYFGGVNGLTAFQPTQVHRHAIPPPVHITSARAFDRELLAGLPPTGPRSVVLRHFDNVLSFEFVALDYRSPEGVRYAYRLEGLDHDWTYCGTRRHTTYTHLPPGRFVFTVKAVSTDGVWNERGDSLTVRILPPWWQTPVARAASAVGALGLVVALVQWRTRTLRRRLAEQQRVEATIRESRDQLAAAKEELERYSTRLETMVEERTAQLARANEELEALARSDPLTGLANRRRFVEFIDAEWRRGRRFARPLSVIMADIDFFKSYNDTHGHQAGDECLRRVATALARVAGRPGDLVARWGGEEFVAVLAETPIETAAALAERMRAGVEALAIPHGAAPAGRVTVSLGVAAWLPTESETWEALVEAADGAMYQAKGAGRNRVVAAPMAAPCP